LAIALQSAFMFAVKAGLMFSGDEKNCEKLGSCAFDRMAISTNTHIKIFTLFIIINLPY